MNYKTRIHHAISEGIMGVVKEAWHPKVAKVEPAPIALLFRLYPRPNGQ